MELLRIANGELAFGEDKILDKADLSVQTGERICLVGRNGAGKSTLMKILMGLQTLDDGQILKSSTMKMSMLEQDPPESSEMSVFDYVAQGVQKNADLIRRYHALIHDVTEDPSEKNLDKLARVQDQLEQANAWQDEQRIEQAMSTLSLDPEAQICDLSGGWLRKLALAKALVTNPDILLLDEPTNHLDIESVLWLEKFLKDFAGTIIFISHDRAFIRGLSTRILDLDRGQLKSYPGNYDLYIEQKAHDLQVESQQNALFDKRLAEEEVWIRQGIKARRTRNEGRVRSLEKLRLERKARREVKNQSTMNISHGERSGKLVFEAENLTIAFGEGDEKKTIIKNLNLLISRNDRLALIGANGTGKSTLIKMIMEKLEPTSGKMRSGVNLDIAYFDQHREQLDVNQTVQEIVGEGKQEVMVNGKPRHVLGYLQDFLFSPKRARTPVRALSGGEKNRLLLARLFLRPSNLLILDEPTNDLDIETLELLEEVVANYAGTVILVSHDRDFVNNCINTCLYFDGSGQINQIVGGYDDVDSYLAQKEAQRKNLAEGAQSKGNTQVSATEKSTEQSEPTAKQNSKRKLSYKENRELEALPDQIDELEVAIEELQEQVNQADFFAQDDSFTKNILNQLQETESKLEVVYARWQELDEL
jgi:ATP-binding cassette subfamily F protein uup